MKQAGNRFTGTFGFGALSLATGSVLDAAIGASKGKLTGEHALLRSLHGRVAAATRLLVAGELRPVEHGAHASVPPVVDHPASNLSRAPPAVI